TKEIVRQRIAEGYEEPSPTHYERIGGFNVILKAAGIEISNEQADVESCIRAGLSYFGQTGELPNVASMKKKGEVHFDYSDYTIYKYFGSIPDFHETLKQRIDAQEVSSPSPMPTENAAELAA
ncbi:hypothetical protein KW794_03680, partial [Candidatus Saccharibacteria bacterium]|nr:hypothetical protein [Candidatus Saccharibacteria bacterium]